MTQSLARCAASLIAAVVIQSAISPAAAQNSSGVPRLDLPDQRFYALFREFYKGEYSDVGRSYRQLTGYKDSNGFFLDSVCHWGMQAECHYRLGEYRQAVEMQEQALNLYLNWLAWPERTQFPPQIQAAGNAWRQANVTWGTPGRAILYANIPNTFQFLFGRLDNERVAQQGGVIEPPNMQSVDLAQALRCTALCLYRRQQIKGPICARDPLTQKLVASLATVAGNDGTLASAWNNVLLGMAQSSAGKSEQAIATLKSGLQFNGGMDHTLTPLALLQMGQSSFALGNYSEASTFFLEASYAAAVFQQYDVIGEALAGANRCHLRTRPRVVFGPLANAIRWADREGADALQATLLVELLKSQTELGLGREADATLGQIKRLANGNDLDETALAVPVGYSAAALKYAAGDAKAADADLARALQQWRRFSPRLYQLSFADQLLNARRIAVREADLLYAELLRDPSADDWLNDPCDAICFLMTDHVASLQLWYDVLIAERRLEPAFAVADQIRRHRFYANLPLGGRLLTLRWMMEAPAELVSEATLAQRNDWRQRFPDYEPLSREVTDTIDQLRTIPLVPESESADAKRQRTLLDQLSKAATIQEQILTGIALRREPAELAFARPLAVISSDPLFPTKTLLLACLETNQGISVVSVADRVITLESTANKKSVSKVLGDLLRQLGNVNGSNSVELAELKPDLWMSGAAELHKLLFPNRTAGFWAEFDEIVIIPDGDLWYAPLELLLNAPAAEKPLRIRYAPMVAMAVPNRLPPAQFPRTLLAGRRSTDKKLQTRFDEQLALLKTAIPNVEILTSAGKMSTNLLAATADRLIAWDDDWKSLPESAGDFSWIPDASGKVGHRLSDWRLLPWFGPRLLVVPQFATDADSGLKSNRANGQELFQLTAEAIASGAQTILISRWNVGNSSSFQASTEFANAWSGNAAIDAWQATIAKIKTWPVDVGESSRIKAPKEGAGELKSDHPFFWAGYLLVDTGWRPPATEPPPAEVAQ